MITPIPRARLRHRQIIKVACILLTNTFSDSRKLIRLNSFGVSRQDLLPGARDGRQKSLNFSKSGNPSPHDVYIGNKKPLGEREPRRRGVGTCCFRLAAGAKEGATERMKGCEEG